MWALKSWVHQISHKTSNKNQVMIEGIWRQLVGHCHDCSAKFSHFFDLLELSRVFLELRKERRRVGFMVSTIMMCMRVQNDQAQKKGLDVGMMKERR